MINTVNDIKTVAIIGAGTMGLGIAQICAMSGFKTILFDIEKDSLSKAEKAIIGNLDKGIEKGKVSEEDKAKALDLTSYTSDIKSVIADFIIEAIVENLDVKRKVFHQLEALNADHTILASNTSSIPITKIASVLTKPGRMVGMHFFNPAHIMKLVEVISGAATDNNTTELTVKLAEKLNKTPVRAQDSPGFIVNRVARHFYVESLKVLEEGITDVEGLDRLMETSGFRMGPFKLMDLIGVDTNYSVTESMFRAFHEDPKFRPNRIQEQKVNAGHHGRKSGRGFYNYE